MSIFYIAALVIASIFWVIVITWLVKGEITRIKAMPKKQPVTKQSHLPEQKAVTQRSAQINTYQADQIKQS